MLVLGLTPDPLTPWWIYAVVGGKEGLPLERDYIHAIDPASAQTLAPWFKFHASDILDDKFNNPVRQLLIYYLNLDDVRTYNPSKSCLSHTKSRSPHSKHLETPSITRRSRDP
jgi:hypothetical protein